MGKWVQQKERMKYYVINYSKSSRKNSRHLATLPLVSPLNDIWKMSTEIPYWWCVTTQIWEVLLIGWIKFPTWHNQNQKHYPIISMEFLHSFLRHRFMGKPMVALHNVGCFLRLLQKMSLDHLFCHFLVPTPSYWGSSN